ncbi:MAG TPA: sigma 54-interacting transcriptional regulator [Candidatus Limnocylindria bacterium]|nr:sigma 54-interacting transcriptional regulator [Candidatus Limnocylindria bacterium]
MEAVRETVRRLPGRQHVSRRLPSILLQGETGTGKGLVARLIHRLGPRAAGEFVDVNCAAIPETLLESELFGFERGAFTDARKAKPGLFQTAHQGTIFLDEIGSTPEALQAKLLTVIEERVVRRLGGTRPEPADAWIISATNTDLHASVRERRFREDLYHRLAVLTLRLPPLRERDGDVLLLAGRFLARVCADYGLPVKTLAADARDRLMAYSWPGNVRELSNVIERAALLAEESVLTSEHLELGDAASPSGAPAPGPVDAARPLSLGEAMREHLRATLDQTGWNISRTAAILSISRNTLRARMEKLGLREGGAAVRRDARPPAGRPPAAPPPSGSAPGLVSRSALPTVRWARRRIALMRVVLLVPETGDVLSDAARALEALIEKVRSFGGQVEALGQRALEAAFGVEPIEDAPRRAAHAAMAMRRAVERIRGDSSPPLAARIAIHAAQAMVAQAGHLVQIDQEAKEQGASVLGDLIAAAEPGTILASPAAGALLERRFELVPVGGPDGAPTAFRLVGREGPGLGPAGRMASFVGRQQEMAVLHSRLLAALRGRGLLVSIVGDAGIGKSRLLHEFRQSVSADQAIHIEGHCLSYGSTIPYLPVLDLIRAVCRITEADDATAATEKIRHTLGQAGMEPGKVGPYLVDLLGYKDGTDGLDQVPPDTVKAGISEALRQITLGASHRQPLLVVIEDLHWIDQASEELVASMVDGLPGAAVLFVVTYRPGYEPPWTNKSFATQLSLPPLSNEDSLTVTRSVLPGAALPHAVAEVILSRAEGNPFFLEELALSIQDRGGLAGDLAVPDTVQGVLLSRIGHLPEAEQALLQSAAVIGKDVPLPVLAAVAELPEAALGQALRHLSAAEFLYEVGSFPEVKYRFRHALTHEVAYESLRPERRRHLHGRIVLAIEAIHSDRLIEDVDRLAHHAMRGELWEKAVEYSRQAGAKAAARSAHLQAVAYFEQALEALAHLSEDRPRLEQAIDLRLELRNSLHPLGDPERILALLREAEGLARTLDDPRRLARVFSFMTQYFRLMGHLDLAVESAERALALADRLRDAPLWIVANTFLGTAYDARGEYRKAADVLRKSVEALAGISIGQEMRVAGLVPVFARIYLVYCLADMGEFREGLVHGDEGTRLALAADDAYSLIFASCGVGTLHLLKGDVGRAIDTLEPGLALCRTLTVPVALPLIAGALGAAYSLASRSREAIALLEEGAREGLAIGRLGGHSLLVARLGEAYLRAGRLDDADETAGRALAMAREKSERGHEAYALHLLGEVLARRAPVDPGAADAAFRQASALAEELSMRPLLAHCHASRARLECRARRVASSRQLFDAGIATFRALEMPFWLERTEAEARALA